MQLHIDAEQKQLSNQSLQIGGLSAGVQPRDLSEQQSKKLTDVFHGTSLHVDVQRCISAESAVTLSNDFVTAFRSANATVGYNNVTNNVHSRHYRGGERTRQSHAGFRVAGIRESWYKVSRASGSQCCFGVHRSVRRDKDSRLSMTEGPRSGICNETLTRPAVCSRAASAALALPTVHIVDLTTGCFDFASLRVARSRQRRKR